MYYSIVVPLCAIRCFDKTTKNAYLTKRVSSRDIPDRARFNTCNNGSASRNGFLSVYGLMNNVNTVSLHLRERHNDVTLVFTGESLSVVADSCFSVQIQ